MTLLSPYRVAAPIPKRRPYHPPVIIAESKWALFCRMFDAVSLTVFWLTCSCRYMGPDRACNRCRCRCDGTQQERCNQCFAPETYRIPAEWADTARQAFKGWCRIEA